MVFSFLRIPALKLKRPISRLVPARNVVSTMHGSRTVLLDARNGHYWGLDEVGSRIWALAQQGLSIDEITLTLCEEYDAPPERLRADTEHFFNTLVASKLLEVA